MLGEGGEDVEAEREQLEADEDDEQVLRGGDEQAAGGGHEHYGDVLAGVAGEDGVDEQQKRERGEGEDCDLGDGGRAARGRAGVRRRQLRACPACGVYGPKRGGAAEDAEACGDGDARFERGFAQEAEIDDENQQRGDFESGFRERGAEEASA